MQGMGSAREACKGGWVGTLSGRFSRPTSSAQTEYRASACESCRNRVSNAREM